MYFDISDDYIELNSNKYGNMNIYSIAKEKNKIEKIHVYNPDMFRSDNKHSKMVNQRRIIKQNEIKKKYDEIYFHNKFIPECVTNYKRLESIFNSGSSEMQTNKKNDLNPKFKINRLPSTFQICNINPDDVKNLEKRFIRSVQLSSMEKKKIYNVFRKGITEEDFKLKKSNEDKEVQFYELFNKKKPIEKVLNKKAIYESDLLFKIEKDFKPVKDYANKQIRKSQLAMEKEVHLEFSKDFKVIEPYKFTKRFRTTDEIIEFEKYEERKRLAHLNLSKNDVFNEYTSVNRCIINLYS